MDFITPDSMDMKGIIKKPANKSANKFQAKYSFPKRPIIKLHSRKKNKVNRIAV